MKKFFIAFIISIVISIVIFPIRGIDRGIPLCSIVGYIFYFLFTVIYLKKTEGVISKKIILLSILSGIGVVQLPLRIIDFQRTLLTFPDFLMHVSGIVSGYIAYNKKYNIKWSVFFAGLAICIFMFFKGYTMWIDYLNYDTFTGKIDDNREYNLKIQTNTGDTLSLYDFRGKYLLFDCWNSFCGICYKKMPEVQKLYDIYKGNTNVVIGSMHSYMKNTEKLFNDKEKNEDYTTGSEILKGRNYTFPCWAIAKNDPVLKEIGVDSYPTVLIFNKQGKLIFRGSIENAKNQIEKLLKGDGK